ncbi:hypothetical protein ACM9HF_04555 [Colwellia sp. RE-S-Sl-9]
MSPNVLADLIISLVLICVGLGLIAHGKKLKSTPPAKSNFASPNVFIVLGSIMLVTQLMELVKTYM